MNEIFRLERLNQLNMNILGWIITGVAALLLLSQLAMWLQARRSHGRPAPDTRAVDGEAAADPVRVYYFYSERCGHCRTMMPLVECLRVSHRNLVKLDTAEAHELARAFGVVATPCFIQVADGLIRRVKLGALSEKQLRALLLASA